MSDVDTEFCAYVRGRQPALLRTAYLLTGDHHRAEDLLQTALTKTYLAWRRIERPGAVDAYVRKVMVNEQTSWWRRTWHGERPVQQLPDVSGPDLGAVADERDAMWQAVLTLPPRQRAAVVLRYYEDLPEAQVAELLGCSVGTIKSQTSRALSSLRARLGEGEAAGAAPGGVR